MRLQIGDRAPYAPGQVVVDLIKRQRHQGTLKTVDATLLERVGVTESLRPRTMASLRILGLIDEDGNVTEVMESLKRGSEAEYRRCLADHIKTVYGEVFDVIDDPATASSEVIEDAFRGYEPHGQRNRMVVLFLSLCQEAGLVEEVVRERASSVGRTARKPLKRTKMKREDDNTGGSGGTDDNGENTYLPSYAPPAPPRVDPLIAAYVSKLPPGGTVWPSAARERYLAALSSIFDIVYEESDVQ